MNPAAIKAVRSQLQKHGPMRLVDIFTSINWWTLATIAEAVAYLVADRQVATLSKRTGAPLRYFTTEAPR